MNRTYKALIAIVAVLAMMMLNTGCSTVATQSDEQGLHYNGGPFASKTYKNCVGPSVRNYDSIGDKHYIYPAGQRTFSFTGANGSESHPIAVTTKEGQEVDVPGFITFTLTSDCKKLRKFHEQIGLKYQAYGLDSHGWSNFLNDYLYTPLNSAMNQAAQDIPPTTLPAIGKPGQADYQAPVNVAGWQALYTSTAVQQKFAEDVKSALPGDVRAALGDDYLTINDVQISKPTVPDALKAAIQAKQEAIQENAAQAAKNDKILTQFDTIGECLKTGLSESNCTLIFLSQSGADIPFLPIPQGGGVNYNSVN
jgi:hypothetical protein